MAAIDIHLYVSPLEIFFMKGIFMDKIDELENENAPEELIHKFWELKNLFEEAISTDTHDIAQGIGFHPEYAPANMLTLIFEEAVREDAVQMRMQEQDWDLVKEMVLNRSIEDGLRQFNLFEGFQAIQMYVTEQLVKKICHH